MPPPTSKGQANPASTGSQPPDSHLESSDGEHDLSFEELEVRANSQADDARWARPTEAQLQAFARVEGLSPSSVECGLELCRVAFELASDLESAGRQTTAIAQFTSRANETLPESYSRSGADGRSAVVMFTRRVIFDGAEGGGPERE